MSETPETHVTESDPNADSPEGLAGEMGVSSERRGIVRGGPDDVTHTVAPTYVDEDEDAETPPEQSARSGEPEVQPDPVESHPFDSDRNPRHGI